ncbi:hypothetical protein JXL21_04920 [Candidatus Bathyarchaeota archaeon]|nr:hypothetical protein [Candidatus Bathyarchaeota archaeon]
MNTVAVSIVGAVSFSFAISYVLIPYFNRYMHKAGIVGRDIMKAEKTEVADMGGPGVIVGFLMGVFFFIGVEIFMPPRLSGIIYILASLNTILIITLMGIFDTLTALMKKREGEGFFEQYKKIGIPRWLYFFLPLPAAVPLAAVNAGVSRMTLPFIGRVEMGLWYPLVLVPVAVLCCSNATNFLAGFNGLEAGMGVVLHLSLGLYAYHRGHYNAAMIALCFAAALLAFLRYNWYPAKVFPGDLNYTIGAVCACVAVIGNMEKFAVLCFAPYAVEAVLKAASGFEAESYGILQPDGTVKPRDGKIGGLTHVVMRIGDFSEWQVTLILVALEAAVCVAAALLVPYV